VPTFVKKLRQVEGTSARALEFGMLTAARTAEIVGALWSEFDEAVTTWTIPSERMKGREVHVVHLAVRAAEIVKAQQGIGSEYVFASPRDSTASLSNMAMALTLRRMGYEERTTVHGLCRATFSTWAYESARAREEIVEACLAHKEEDRVKAAYNRARHHAARKHLLQSWADFMAGKMGANEGDEDDSRVQSQPGARANVVSIGRAA